VKKRIAVYCGASPNVPPKLLESAASFGALLAKMEIGVVYGGCKTGLMGAVADGCLGGGGEVIGVLPDVLSRNPYGIEPTHTGLTQLLRVPDMHTRKAVMTAYADAFVALPGGYGTLDELFEALTWKMIGTHDKPIGLLDVDGYWKHLVAFIDHAAGLKLVNEKAHGYFVVDDDAARLVGRLLPGSGAPG
jgi:uncharacterized protein (TIGR00730 family)